MRNHPGRRSGFRRQGSGNPFRQTSPCSIQTVAETRHLQEIRRGIGGKGLCLLCFRYRRGTFRKKSRSGGGKGYLHIQPYHEEVPEKFAFHAGKRVEAVARNAQGLDNKVHDAGKQDGENGRPYQRPYRGQYGHSRRQGAVETCRRAAYLSSRQYCGRSSHGDNGSHQRRGMAPVAAVALSALRSIRMAGYHAAFRPSVIAAET